MKQALQSGICLAFVAAIAYALKHHYSVSTSEDLLWILQPTAALVSFFTQTPFLFEREYGFISTLHRFAIEPSCAGVNFMIAAFSTMTLLWIPSTLKLTRKLLFIPIALCIAYLCTIGVNTARIVIAIALSDSSIQLGSLSGDQLHRIEGIAVYLVSLFVISFVCSNVQRRVANA